MEPGYEKIATGQEERDDDDQMKRAMTGNDSKTHAHHNWSLVVVPKVPPIEKARIPKFTLRGYLVRATAKPRVEKEKVEEEQRVEERRRAKLEIERRGEERKRREYREERERKTAMFTMPGYPPLAMAPDIDPEYLESLLPSDKQYERLFPDNPELICKAKDLFGERAALDQYRGWLVDMRYNQKAPAIREQFYLDLLNEMKLDCAEVFREYHDFCDTATPLGLFELFELDRDLRTTRLEEKLRNGDIYISNEHDPSVQAVYGYLFSKYPYLERFEKYYKLDEGTGKLKNLMSQYAGFLDKQGDDVNRKYGYLRLAVVEKKLIAGSLDVEGQLDSRGMAACEHLFLKYPYLERFERFYKLETGTQYLEHCLMRDEDVISGHEEVKMKYGYVQERVEKRKRRFEEALQTKTEDEKEAIQKKRSSRYERLRAARDGKGSDEQLRAFLQFWYHLFRASEEASRDRADGMNTRRNILPWLTLPARRHE